MTHYLIVDSESWLEPFLWLNELVEGPDIVRMHLPGFADTRGKVVLTPRRLAPRTTASARCVTLVDVPEALRTARLTDVQRWEHIKTSVPQWPPLSDDLRRADPHLWPATNEAPIVASELAEAVERLPNAAAALDSTFVVHASVADEGLFGPSPGGPAHELLFRKGRLEGEPRKGWWFDGWLWMAASEDTVPVAAVGQGGAPGSNGNSTGPMGGIEATDGESLETDEAIRATLQSVVGPRCAHVNVYGRDGNRARVRVYVI